VQLEDGEVIALAWVVYRSKEERDRITKEVMEDPQLKESMDPSKMPFDGKRMFWGGFETIIGLAAGPLRSSMGRQHGQLGGVPPSCTRRAPQISRAERQQAPGRTNG
jgi:hypothetical protein